MRGNMFGSCKIGKLVTVICNMFGVGKKDVIKLALVAVYNYHIIS